MFKSVRPNIYALLFLLTLEAPSSAPQRAIAAINEREVELNKVKQYRSILSERCRDKYPYFNEKRKKLGFINLERSSVYMNRRNRIQDQYWECQIDANIESFNVYGFKREAQRFIELKRIYKVERELEESKSTQYGLTRMQLKAIWQQVKMVKSFYSELIKKYKKFYPNMTGPVPDSFGASFGVNAIAGPLGKDIQYEVINHGGKLGIFCAPGNIGATDVGVSVGVGLVKTYNCHNNENYLGTFLGMGTDISFELLGLPVSASASYSLGIDASRLLRDLRKYKMRGLIVKEDLIEEFKGLMKYYKGMLLNGEVSFNYFMNLAFVTTSIMNSIDKGQKIKLNDVVADVYASYEKRKFSSVGLSIKKLVKDLATHDGVSELYPSASHFLLALSESTTGCDAAGGGLGLSLSLSPVNTNLKISEYSEIAEFDLNDIIFLSTLNPLKLGASMKDKEFSEKLKASLSRTIKSIKDMKLPMMCLYQGEKELFRNTLDIWDLILK